MYESDPAVLALIAGYLRDHTLGELLYYLEPGHVGPVAVRLTLAELRRRGVHPADAARRHWPVMRGRR